MGGLFGTGDGLQCADSSSESCKESRKLHFEGEIPDPRIWTAADETGIYSLVTSMQHIVDVVQSTF